MVDRIAISTATLQAAAVTRELCFRLDVKKEYILDDVMDGWLA